MSKNIDLTGKKFGKLEILGLKEQRGKHFYWNFICDCGSLGSSATTSLLNAGKTHCGCERVSKLKGIPKSSGEYLNGSKSVIAKTRSMMLDRCYNENSQSYNDYGGRGIEVCDRWRFGDEEKTGLEYFRLDMGKKPNANFSLDRIDNSKGYQPDNCKWSSPKEQMRNRRSVKLDLEKAKEIREKFKSGTTKQELSKQYSVVIYTIRQILNNKIWID